VERRDVHQLKDAIFEASTDLARLRTGDSAMLAELSAQLSELRAHVDWYEAQLRARRPVPLKDSVAIRDAIEAVRRRARGDETASAQNVPSSMTPIGLDAVALQRSVELPSGTVTNARLLTFIDFSTVRVDDRVEAATPADLSVNGTLLVPAGALLRGVVTDVQIAKGRRHGRLSVRFDLLTVNYHAYSIRASVPAPMSSGEDFDWVPGALLHIRFEAPTLIVPPPL
jgi:hypothetical protein